MTIVLIISITGEATRRTPGKKINKTNTRKNKTKQKLTIQMARKREKESDNHDCNYCQHGNMSHVTPGHRAGWGGLP